MKTRNINDQLQKIARVVDLEKPITDENTARIVKQFKSYNPKAFEDRVADIRRAKEGVASGLVIRLLDECEKVTIDAIGQYQRQLYFLLQSFFDEFEDLQGLRKEASQLSGDFASLPVPAQTMLLGGISESVEYFRDSLAVGKADQNEVCESCILIASNLFDTILPIDNTAAHIETARDVLWTTITTFSTLGLWEYVKVVKRAYPTQRRNIELKGSDQSLKFYETYYKAMVDWDNSSKAWQLRVEMDLR